MDVWGPWPAYLRMSGGVISGNLEILGTLKVDGVTTHNDDVIVDDARIDVIYDSFSVVNWAIRVRPKTAGGNYNVIMTANLAAVALSGFGTDMSGNLEVCIASGQEYRAPCNLIEPDPLWKIPLQPTPLGVRRQIMLNSMLMGI